MPRYRYGHVYAQVTKKGRIVEIAEWNVRRWRVVQDCQNWNDTHRDQHHVVKIEMKWKKPQVRS
jgi:hypothetical protein